MSHEVDHFALIYYNIQINIVKFTYLFETISIFLFESKINNITNRFFNVYIIDYY